ncbi:MAG: NADH-quinone oxidoreductase subunit C, partial [Candidatus Methanomethyliaceae archaeon]
MKFSTNANILEFAKEIYPNGLEYQVLHENRIAIKVRPEDLEAIAETFINKFKARLIHITAVDLGIKGFEILHIYDFSKIKERAIIILKTHVKNPEVPSISKITWQARWAERENMELLGINFLGIQDSRHQFLPFEW